MSTATHQRFTKLLTLVQTGPQAEADTALRQALRTTPKDPNLLQLAAQFTENRGDKTKAIELYRRTLAVHPNGIEAAYNLARLLHLSAAPAHKRESLALLRGLSERQPHNPMFYEALARFEQADGALDEAIKDWRKTLALSPHNNSARGQYAFCCRAACDWQEEILQSADLPPHISVLFEKDPLKHKASAERYCTHLFGKIKPLPVTDAYSHERVRLGYLSSDFHAHATSYLIAELFELHDRTQFETFIYSYGVDDQSTIRERIKTSTDHFTELNKLTPKACAEKIRADEIDILIDLKGHTTGGRLDILAYRPAPIQMHWLGFPGTTGASFIDYFIADDITAPKGTEALFTETLMRLPHCYQINDRHKKASAHKTKSELGLPAEKIILVSFNQSYKITPEIFSVWCDILKQRDNTILWLLASNPYAEAHLRAHFTKAGLNPNRLFFAPPTGQEDHLARYNHADICLDTAPIGGHTTTSDALFMGVPVVSLMGQTFISRVAASLLTAAKQTDLITKSLTDYQSKIIDLIDHLEKRALIKTNLKENATSLPLFDTERFVKNWEEALKNIKKETL